MFGLTGVLGFEDLDELALHVFAVFHDDLLWVIFVLLDAFLVGDRVQVANVAVLVPA